MGDLSVAAVARDLGLVASGRGWGPCPACGEARRGAEDRRGPIGLRADVGWRCHRCRAGGVARHLVAWSVAGSGDLSDAATRRAVSVWLADRRYVIPEAAPEPPDWTRYPERWEVADLWERCTRDDEQVRWWLDYRRIGVQALDQDLCRCLPPTGYLPAWATHWRAKGARCLVPLYDRLGDLRSLQGRVTIPDGKGPKSLGARAGRKGLVYASPAGLRALDGASCRTVIAEGEPDYLTWAVRGGPVLGIPGTGAWTAELGAALRGEVLIRTHRDEAGHRYADAIAATLTVPYRRHPRPE